MGIISPGHRSMYHQFLGSKDLGGGELVGINLCSFLLSLQLETKLWTPSPQFTTPPGLSLRPDVVLRYDACNATRSGIIRPLASNIRLSRQLRGYGAGLVHFHSHHLYGAISMAARLSGLRTVVHVHIEEQPELFRWIFKRPPDLIIPCSRHLGSIVRSALSNRILSRTKITAVPNAVDLNIFYPDDKARCKAVLGINPQEPMLLMLANLSKHKGQETVIRAVSDLRSRGVTIRAYLAGSERNGGEAYTTYLKSLIAELDMTQHVFLVGFRRDAPQLIRAADFMLLPSTHEGLPLSLLEAQASNTIVLAAPTAGIPEIVSDGSTGFLIDAHDHRGYADRIQSLLSNSELSRSILAAALAQARSNHNWSDYCRTILDLYQETCSS